MTECFAAAGKVSPPKPLAALAYLHSLQADRLRCRGSLLTERYVKRKHMIGGILKSQDDKIDLLHCQNAKL
jgi:hypothetical protein